MSFIGKKIGDVLPGIERAKVLLEREVEVKDPEGRGTGVRVRDRLLDVDGNGRGDVLVTRRTEKGRFTDSFSLDNDAMTRDGTQLVLGGSSGHAPIERNAVSRHDRTTLEADEGGTVRMEHHWDYANGDQRNFSVADANRDGKIDHYSLQTSKGGLRELIDTDGDGRLDREITFTKDEVEKKNVQLDPFFLDER